MPDFYAHSKKDAPIDQWQKLYSHLINTAQLASEFGADSNVSELAYIAGLFHDLGKYSPEFQNHLQGSKLLVDHSTAGAKELLKLYENNPAKPLIKLLAYAITGHHSGLLDHGNKFELDGRTLSLRLKKEIPDYSAYESDFGCFDLTFPATLKIRPMENNLGFSISFLVRMIFSALVDADFQETEAFILNTKPPRGSHETIKNLCEQFNASLKRFDHPESPINKKRTETLQSCVQKSEEQPGFFKLTVPTGGGKTLASMAFALNHAAKHGMRHVIYVIPYTTIIEQNAGRFKEILGEENVLEHHSNFDWDSFKQKVDGNPDDATNSAYDKLRLASENWDIPIIVTTNVEFFESLYANKSSRSRKLHNIANSVIVFDEAQMFPRDFMKPCMAAVWELVVNYKCSAVFCTATQPNLEKFLPEEIHPTELAPNPEELFEFYKRVEVKDLGYLTDEALIAQVSSYQQVLCIVNTRRHAQQIFKGMDKDGRFHLSTLMCPAHRKKQLIEIQKRLSAGNSCRVISTSVMESGIDIDFPVGFRAIAGLDSINQAAGRVNREMKLKSSQLYIFEPVLAKNKKTPKYVQQASAVTSMILRDFPDAPISIPAVEKYFEQLYSVQDPAIAFDFKSVMKCFENINGEFEFETAASRFRIIDDLSQPVIIPYDERALSLIDELKYSYSPMRILRRLQPFTVSIYQNEFDELCMKGAIWKINDRFAVLDSARMDEFYDPETGLNLPEGDGGSALFF